MLVYLHFPPTSRAFQQNHLDVVSPGAASAAPKNANPKKKNQAGKAEWSCTPAGPDGLRDGDLGAAGMAGGEAFDIVSNNV